MEAPKPLCEDCGFQILFLPKYLSESKSRSYKQYFTGPNLSRTFICYPCFKIRNSPLYCNESFLDIEIDLKRGDILKSLCSLGRKTKKETLTLVVPSSIADEYFIGASVADVIDNLWSHAKQLRIEEKK